MKISTSLLSVAAAFGVFACAAAGMGQASPFNQFAPASLVGNPYQGSYDTYAAADFNRDGKPDLLVRNWSTSTTSSPLTVLLGNGKNQYVSKTVSDSASHLNMQGDPQVADMNGDGFLDIVTATQGQWDDLGKFTTEGEIDIYFGKGDGTFRSHVSVATGQYMTPFIVDVNKDGKQDLVVGTYPYGDPINSGIQVFLNDGHGVLTQCPPLVLNTGGFNTAIVAAGDITHKGSIDFITGPMAGGRAAPWHKPYQIVTASLNGALRLGPTLPYSLSISMKFCSPVADYNGDGNLDYPLLDDRNGSIVMLLGSKAGTLTRAQTVYISRYNNLGQMVTADFTGDGKPDLAFGYDSPDNVVAVYTGLGNGKLSNPRIYGERHGLGGLLAGDFNLDGKPDLIAGSVTLMLNTGKGFFTGPVFTQTIPNVPVSLVTGDFNRDGMNDVAVDTCESTVKIFVGTGSYYYKPPVSYPVTAQGGLFAAGDLNKDGITDFVIMDGGTYCNPPPDYYPSRMNVLLGKPDGTFSPAIEGGLPGRGSPGPEAHIVDMNMDGIPDLVGTWGVLIGNGDGTFLDIIHFTAEGVVRNFAIGDFNNDGYPDVALAIYQISGPTPNYSGYAQILFNTHDGRSNWQTGGRIALPGVPSGIKAVDLDRDDKLDLAITSRTSFTTQSNTDLFVAKGNGNGTFGPVVSYASPNLSLGYQIKAEDFDHDGRMDLLIPASWQNGDKGGIAYFHGVGDGTFVAPMFYENPTNDGILITNANDSTNGIDVFAIAGIGFSHLTKSF